MTDILSTHAASVRVEDIQVFILTFNRPDYLRVSIESVLSQSLQGFSVAILDNGDDPETERVVADYGRLGVSYCTSRHLGRQGNTLLAQMIAQGKYLMLFHDDDQLHPDYIRNVLSVINTYPDINLITGKMAAIPAGTSRPFTEPLEPVGYLLDQKMFANFRYNSGACYFPITVYKTELFKKLDFPSLYESYGKWLDNPLIVQMVQDGKAFVFIQSCGWYGIHLGQDCVDQNTLPEFNAWLNIEKTFLTYLGDDPTTFSGSSFCMLNYRHLASGYKRRVKKTISFPEYVKAALDSSSMTTRSYRFRFFANRFIQNLFLLISRLYFKKQICRCPNMSKNVL